MSPATRKRINVNLLIPFLFIALVFGFTIWQKYRASRELPVVPQVHQPVGKRTAVLFFVQDGTRLAREARELDPCAGETACVKSILEELLNGPVGEFDESLPEGTVFNSVLVEGELAGIDLNKAFAEALPSGSSAEMLAVYSIVNSIAANFPQITKVKINLDGDGKAVLRHLDLSDPLVPDYTLEQPPVPPAPKTSVPPKSKTKKEKP
jgi:hypothetical protein